MAKPMKKSGKKFGCSDGFILLCNSKYFKMDEQKYRNDLSEIRSMMHRSSQFISLSGLSGVLAGIYALTGAFVAHDILRLHTQSYVSLESQSFKMVVLIAVLVLALSVTTAFVLTYFKAKKHNEPVWNSTTKRLMLNFLIPLGSGGIFTLLLLRHGLYGLVAPATLLFYGLACVNASKYTLRDVRYLGLTLVALGLLCTEFPGYGLAFWAAGFGLCHIFYGAVMYFKYDRKPGTDAAA